MSKARVLAVVWTFVTLGLHSIPRAQLLELPGGETLVSTSGSDKVAHVFLFGVLALLWTLGTGYRPLAVVAGGLAYGAILELYQEWLIPGRSGSLPDLVADAVGLAIGAGIAARWFRGKAGGP